MAQLLFACPRSSKDTQTSIYFFTTRVNDPEEDNWRKLKRLLRYVRRTVNMPPVLRVDSLTIIKWLVNASNATHPYMRGHTGGTMPFGKVSVLVIAKNQKPMQRDPIRQN